MCFYQFGLIIRYSPFSLITLVFSRSFWLFVFDHSISSFVFGKFCLLLCIHTLSEGRPTMWCRKWYSKLPWGDDSTEPFHQSVCCRFDHSVWSFVLTIDLNRSFLFPQIELRSGGPFTMEWPNIQFDYSNPPLSYILSSYFCYKFRLLLKDHSPFYGKNPPSEITCLWQITLAFLKDRSPWRWRKRCSFSVIIGFDHWVWSSVL